ncbi:MAG TPA: hypothetical protein VMF69_03195 [Gemmataceae bacterium]|nr:hypothetical protein [Gemmataceae bacterium]
MAWLLFLDESGHDHKQMPYEVRGGIAFQDSQLWSFSADLCIYCVNWCFRLPSQGMNEPVREEIRFEFFDWLRDLQYHGAGYRDGEVFESWGIFFVPNPYGAGRA